jgi:hypothetical protein
VASRCEYLDFNTTRRLDVTSVLEALAATLPDGLAPLALVPVSPQAPSLSKVAGGALYSVELPLENENGRSVLRLAPEETKGKDRQVKLEVRGAVLLLMLERCGESLRVRLGLRMSCQGAVKPVEILRAALGSAPAAMILSREDLLVGEGDHWVSPLEGAGADASLRVDRGHNAPSSLDDLLGASAPAIVPPPSASLSSSGASAA